LHNGRQTFFLFVKFDKAACKEKVTNMHISTRPVVPPDWAVSSLNTLSIAPKHSSRLSGENFGEARDQTSASDFEQGKYSSSRFCKGKLGELDNTERTIGSNGTRFKRVVSHVALPELAFEPLVLTDISISCMSFQYRTSKTGFDVLQSLLRTHV
jgi:hypothetical protein